MPHNIQRSAFRKGEYIGYGVRGSYAIQRWGKGDRTWRAFLVFGSDPLAPIQYHAVFGRTLADIGRQIQPEYR